MAKTIIEGVIVFKKNQNFLEHNQMSVWQQATIV